MAHVLLLIKLYLCCLFFNLIQIADYELVFTLAYICRRLAQRGRIPGDNFQHTAFISPNLDI